MATTLIILVAHAPLASALRDVALHAFPDCAAQVLAVDVSAQDDPQGAALRIRPLIKDHDALILCDVFGATPANAASLACEGSSSRVVCGLSIPMLWRTLCYASEPVDALVGRAVDGAVQGVIRVASSRRQNQPVKAVTDDPKHLDDQQ